MGQHEMAIGCLEQETKILSEDQATGPAKELDDEIKAAFGEVPNFFKAQAAINPEWAERNFRRLSRVMAPGALTTSSGPGGGTLTEGGTSQATPHVAGAAAVLLQARPSLSPSEIIAVLAQTGIPITDRKNGVSVPRINLRAALDAVR